MPTAHILPPTLLPMTLQVARHNLHCCSAVTQRQLRHAALARQHHRWTALLHRTSASLPHSCRYPHRCHLFISPATSPASPVLHLQQLTAMAHFRALRLDQANNPSCADPMLHQMPHLPEPQPVASRNPSVRPALVSIAAWAKMWYWGPAAALAATVTWQTRQQPPQQHRSAK